MSSSGGFRHGRNGQPPRAASLCGQHERVSGVRTLLTIILGNWHIGHVGTSRKYRFLEYPYASWIWKNTAAATFALCVLGQNNLIRVLGHTTNSMPNEYCVLRA